MHIYHFGAVYSGLSLIAPAQQFKPWYSPKKTRWIRTIHSECGCIEEDGREAVSAFIPPKILNSSEESLAKIRTC